MDMKNFKGRTFENYTTGEKDDDGYWHVNVTIIEKLSVDGERWDEENITASAMDTDFDMAHQVSLRSVLQEMQDLVYSRGFDSLIEARAYERSLEKSNVSSSEDNKDTAS